MSSHSLQKSCVNYVNTLCSCRTNGDPLCYFSCHFLMDEQYNRYVPKQLTIGVKFHTARSKLVSRSNFQEIGDRETAFKYVNRILLYKVSTIFYVHILFYSIDIFQLFPLDHSSSIFVLPEACIAIKTDHPDARSKGALRAIKIRDKGEIVPKILTSGRVTA